jgi:alpha-tubulin suppressor-like RCC1 family protein
MKILEKYEVKEYVIDPRVAVELDKTSTMFNWKNKTEFSQDLKQRAYQVFKKTGHKADLVRWIQHFIMTLVLLSFFKSFVTGTSFLTLILYPVFVWVWGVNLFHDARYVQIYCSRIIANLILVILLYLITGE